MNTDEQQLAALGATTKKTPAVFSAVIHPGVKCHKCGVMPICGIRYRCSVCFDFDYCEQCEALHHDKHPQQHHFLKIRHPFFATPSNNQLIGGGGPIITCLFESDE